MQSRLGPGIVWFCPPLLFAAKQSELEQLIAASCQQIIHANEAFANSELRTFQEVRAVASHL